MAEVEVFLNEEWPALGDTEALEKQLEQCTVSHLHHILYIAIITIERYKFLLTINSIE